jgi:phosphohistidine swiveling domain-containing protein
MSKKHEKLFFEPAAYRDWTVIYCQLGCYMWTKEFRKQFRWGISDICYVWNGYHTTTYRIPEEYLDGMFYFVKKQLKKDPKFIRNVCKKTIKKSADFEKYFNKYKSQKLEDFSEIKLKNLFNGLTKRILSLAPSVFIIIYFPQGLEKFPEEIETFRDARKDAIDTRDKIDKILGPLGNQLFENIGRALLKKVKISEDFARFITIDEAKDILRGKIITDNLKKELKKRSNYFLVGEGKVWYLPIKQYLLQRGWGLSGQKNLSRIKNIKGMSILKQASIIRGVVKIVKGRKELSKIKKGDIIISPMTTPEYAPIFKKVKAIITDEGGVTCHAAVISREFEIPAVVGTKIATKVLKDGDLVEIDANDGIVKIIKRK